MTFTDEDISNVEVVCHFYGAEKVKAVSFDVSDDGWHRASAFFTLEELKQLIKLIEETN